MSKGYWVARVDVTDTEQYKTYITANAVAFAKYGARFLVRSGAFEAVEGTARSRKTVHLRIEFSVGEASALAHEGNVVTESRLDRAIDRFPREIHACRNRRVSRPGPDLFRNHDS